MKPSSSRLQLIGRFRVGCLAAPAWLSGLAAVGLLVVGLLVSPPRSAADQVAAPTVTSSIIGQHMVQSGDTLYCLGRTYGVLPAAIAGANNLRWPYPLSLGQVLLIPAAPWGSVPPGPVCAAQFKSPFPGFVAATPTSMPTTRPTSSPAPQAPTSAIAVTVAGRHVVRAGETLFCIGRGYRVPPLAIAAANGLGPPYRLSPGQTLVIPAEQWNVVPSGPVCAPQWTPTTLPPLPTATATNAPREKSPSDTPSPTNSPVAVPSKTPIPTRTPGPTKTLPSAP